MLQLNTVILTKRIYKMDMKLRAILRGFIRWQIKEDLFNNIIIDYELAEHYLEETEKSLKDYGVLDDVKNCLHSWDYSENGKQRTCLNCGIKQETINGF